MLLEKFTRIVDLLKDARSISTRLRFFGEPQTAHEIILLQKILDRVQASVLSIRTELIEMFFPDEPAKANDSDPARVKTIKPSKVAQGAGAVFFDRRHKLEDRRQLYTYIANDRRSGIADRRRKATKAKRSALRVIQPDR